MKPKITPFLLTCFILVISLTDTFGQDYYWSSQRKIPIAKDSKMLLVKAEENSVIENGLIKSNWIEKLERIGPSSLLVRMESTQEEDLAKLAGISRNSIHSFFSESGDEMIPTGEILFQPKPGVSFEEINKLVGGRLTIVKEKYGNYRTLLDDFSQLLEISNQIYESGLVEYAHPNFIMELVKNQNDPLYPQQYYLNNTGQFGGTAGIDINAPQAWAISTGLHNVRVAVIDDGVENHPDINGRVLQGFSPLAPTGFGAPVVGSAHGEACAGIIGATRNNNLGVAGVAPCTDIVPVNIFVGNESSADVAEAIDWAWDEGNADVLSNSWTYPSATLSYDNIIQAIGRARTQGRGGKGSVVVFSSGNYHPGGGDPNQFNGVAFPADVNGVVTVGAVTNAGNIQAYSSRGAEMDLVAPSGGNNVRTTDRPGANGYALGDYTTTFGGTSAACPQVSGTAALMLSVNPNLSEGQVVSMLRSSATDMGGAGFDNTFGYGRLNAEGALNAAVSSIISGPTSLCSSGTAFSIPGLPQGATITWSSSTNITRGSSQGSNPCTFSKTGTGSTGWIRATISNTAGCGTSLVVQKNLSLNSVPMDLIIDTVEPEGGAIYVSAHATGGSAPYKWYINYELIATTSTSYFSHRYECEGGGSVMGVVANCGSDTASYYEDCGGGGGHRVAVYPNPSHSEIFVSMAELSNNQIVNLATPGQGLLMEDIQLTLLDMTGNIVDRKAYPGKSEKLSLDISQHKKGLYFLKIVGREIEDTHHIIID